MADSFFKAPPGTEVVGDTSTFEAPPGTEVVGEFTPEEQSFEAPPGAEVVGDRRVLDYIDAMSPEELGREAAQLYLQNKDLLSPDQVNKLIAAYAIHTSKGLSAEGVVEGIEQGVGHGVRQVVKGGVEFVKSLPTLGRISPIRALFFGLDKKETEELSKAGAALETSATGLGHIVRGTVRNVATNEWQKKLARTLGLPEAFVATLGPEIQADILDPKNFFKEKNWSKRFFNDMALLEQQQKTAEGKGAVFQGIGLTDLLEREGIKLDPEVVQALSTVYDPVNIAFAVKGLSVARTAAGYQLKAGNKVLAGAMTREQAEALLKKVGNAAERIGKKVEGTSKSVSASKAGMTGLLGSVATGGPAGVAVAGSVGAKFTGQAAGKVLTYLGPKLADPKLALPVLEYPAHALRGGIHGGLFMAPFVAGADSTEDAIAGITTGVTLGAGFGAGGVAPGQAKSAAIHLQARGLSRRFSTAADERPVARHQPYGFDETLDKAHDSTLAALETEDPATANLVNRIRYTLQAGDTDKLVHTLYFLSPEEYDRTVGAGGAGSRGKWQKVQIKHKDGRTESRVLVRSAVKAEGAGTDRAALFHEPGHALTALMPDKLRQKLIEDIREVYGGDYEYFWQRYKETAPAEVQQWAKEGNQKQIRDYVENEIAAEMFSLVLRGVRLDGAPIKPMERVVRALTSLGERIGLSEGRLDPQAPGATELGLTPSPRGARQAERFVDQLRRNLPEELPQPEPPVIPREQGVGAPPVSAWHPSFDRVLDMIQERGNEVAAQRLGQLREKLNRGEALTEEDLGLLRELDDLAVDLNLKDAPPEEPPAPPVISEVPEPRIIESPTDDFDVVQPAPRPEQLDLPIQPRERGAVDVEPAPRTAEAPPVIEQPAAPPVIERPAPTEKLPPSIRNKPEAFDKFKGESRAPANARVEDVRAAVAQDPELTPEQKQAVDTLLSNLRTPHDVVYNAAKVQGGTGRVARRADIEEARNNPDLREVATKLASVPLDARLTKGGGAQIQFFSGDKLLKNVTDAVRQIVAAGQEKEIPYPVQKGKLTKEGQAMLADDLRKYGENQDNGYRGDGGKLVRPENFEGFIPDENPNYTPQKLSSEKALDFINLLMAEDPPATARVTAGKVPIQARAKRLAGANQREGIVIEPRRQYKAPFEDVVISDYNPLRVRLQKAGVDLSNLTEVHEWVNVKEIQSATPRPDIKLSPTSTDVTAAGFLPAKTEVTVTGPDGKEYKVRFDGFQDFRVLGRGLLPQFTALEDIPGVTIKGSTTYGPRLTENGYKIPAGISEAANGPQFLPNKSPRAIKEAAIRDEDGNVFTGRFHGEATEKYFEAKDPGNPDNSLKAWNEHDNLEQGYVTNEGEFLTREQAFERATELNQYRPREGEDPELESTRFNRQRELQEQGFTGRFMGRTAGDNPAFQPPQQKDLRKTGLAFKDFFSRVTRGEFGRSEVPFEPILDLEDAAPFLAELANHSGNFDDHIAKSIPTYKEVQVKKGQAIVETFGEEGATMLDIAASEGSFAKTITSLSGGKIKTVSLDPNPDMAKFFREKSLVEGADYVEQAFMEGFEDGGKQIPAYNPTEKFDIVHEAMGFQFISPERERHIQEAKRLMKPDGILLVEEKLRNERWKQNEAKKDADWKAKYFSNEELAAKDRVVGFQQSKQEVKAVGMVDNMVHAADLERILAENFEHVIQYWDSGNFKGYAASNDRARLDALISNMGNLQSEFSTVQTPRTIPPRLAGQHLPASRKFWLEKDGKAKAVKAPKLAEFRKADKIEEALSKPGWTILSATKESIGDGSHPENVKRNQELRAELEESGKPFLRVSGFYKGVDQGDSFLITDISPEEALELGRKYGQESVLVPEGLLYEDDTINPIRPEDTIVGDAAKTQDFYSQVEGGPAFTLGINFDRRVPRNAPSGAFLPREDSPVWFSQLERTVADKMPNAVSVDQLRAILRNPNHGVKAEEIKWSGLDDFLSGKQRVTKKEVQDFLDQNRLEIREVTKSVTKDPLSEDLQAYLDSNHAGDSPGTPEGWTNLSERLERAAKRWQENGDEAKADRYFSMADEAARRAETLDLGREPDGPKYARFQLPGGENYREILFTLPEDRALRALDDKLQSGAALTEAERAQRVGLESQAFRSSHWDEPNVLAHTRINDRVDADGKPGLFIEEIQSDWHQKGRKHGYRESSTDDRSTKKLVAVEKGGFWEVSTEDGEFVTNVTRSEGGATEAAAIAEARRRLQQEPQRTGTSEKVPDAPFRNTWHEMVFRRLVRQAAEEGKEWIGWTTGEMQAERYDLSKYVDTIEYHQWHQGGRLTGSKGREMPLIRWGVTPEKLADYIGKEAAEKLMAQEPDANGWRSLQGIDLKVGGAGMKGFYDKIMVDYANKFGKKFGAKVEERQIRLPAGDVAIHSLPITSAMRESVLQGQAMFLPRKFWLEKNGTLKDAKSDHAKSAAEELKLRVTNDTTEQAITAKMERGALRGELVDNTLFLDGIPLGFRDLPKAQRTAIEDLAFERGVEVYYNGEPVDVGPMAGQFMGRKKRDNTPRDEFGRPLLENGRVDYDRWEQEIGTEALDKYWEDPTAWELAHGGKPVSKESPTAWILPDGKVDLVKDTGFGGHADKLNEKAAEYNKKYGTSFATDGSLTDADRLAALKAGFTRVRYVPNGGILTFEALAGHWDRVKKKALKHTLDNLPKVDNLRVHLFDDAENLVADHSVRLTQYHSTAKQQQAVRDLFAAVKPVVGTRKGGPTAIQIARSLPEPAEDPGMGGAFLPERRAVAARRPIADQLELGKPPPPVDRYDRNFIKSLSKQELEELWPEALVLDKKPNKKGNLVPPKVDYNLVDSPLVREAGSVEAAIEPAAKKLAGEYRKFESWPETQAGRAWYSRFYKAAEAFFGKELPIFTEFLAALSPRTDPKQNFAAAWEAYRLYKAGWFDDLIAGFERGLDKLEDGSLLREYRREVPKRKQVDDPGEGTLLTYWIKKNDLKPKKAPRLSKGAEVQDEVLFNAQSVAVLKVAARRWLDMNAGPKTRQFVQNLQNVDHGATIDIWAARSLRRITHDGYVDRWRLLPENEKGVSDADFAFGQKVFKKAAEELGLTPSELQGAMWFLEKRLWAENGWAPLDLGDYVPHLESLVKSGRSLEDYVADVPASRSEALAEVKIQRRERLKQERAEERRRERERLEIQRARRRQQTLELDF